MRHEVRTQMRTAQRGSIPIARSLPSECHEGLIELARCRSDLFSASSFSRRARKTGCSCARGLEAQVIGIEDIATGHYRPQDPGVLGGQIAAVMLAPPSVLPYAHDKRMRVLGTTGKTRFNLLPDVATFV